LRLEIHILFEVFVEQIVGDYSN